MKKILIFKKDRIGDFLNISPILYNLKHNFPEAHITIVCSSYNYSIAKHYTFINKFLIFKHSALFFLIKNYSSFFFNKYDLILQLDSKNSSYLSAALIRAHKKVSIKFIKYKKFFGINIIKKRPSFLISLFYNFFLTSNENYDHPNNKKNHYLSLYLQILKQLNIKIHSEKHYLPYMPTKNIYLNNYYNIHIDERWSFFKKPFLEIFEKKLADLVINNTVVLTSNLGGNDFFHFLSFKYKNNNNIYFNKKATINELINIIYYSHSVISSHTGLTVHIAAAFDKKIIDIVSPKIFNELDRWIPISSNYQRFNFENFFFE